MTEPQVWTLIGVFAAGMFGTITLISTMFLRTMQNGFDGVRTEMRNEFASVRTEFRSEFASVRTETGSEFAGVRTEIRAVHERMDHLDRDVSAIYRHIFGIDRG
ncbi:hypothetical protein ABTZ44_08355 [Microbacterium oxydans]|uniref:hypothetical protein n=1 Tax=Microbacterium TaxID=33882 RepID=UPI000DE3CB40|nr:MULTISPECIES: hypothetical protein [unclassified Microbacterium]MBE7953031.1 hypothetical protein [Microbacterium sp. R1]MCB8045608.1 hypothetical protein [Microbacterium oxydans]NYF26787.1 hypothetical protein [Microbacterium sp. JAI119]RBO73782.1 hypothetical protein DSP71_03435 [Microbacterium sp. H6]